MAMLAASGLGAGIALIELAAGDQPAPDTVLSRAYVERTAPNAPPTPTLPTDPFQRAATRALRGDFGHLQPWQAEGYRRGLRQGVTASKLALCTTFYGTESCGVNARWARRCTMRTAAANRLPRYTLVWHEKAGLRRIEDTGSPRNDARADKLGAKLWIDWWYPTPGDAAFGTHVAAVAVIGEGE